MTFRLKGQKIQLSENDVERQCLDFLRARGYYPVRLHSGRFIMPDQAVVEALHRAGVRFRYSTVGELGIPDYAVLKDDFFLEVKAPGKQPSPAQVRKAFELTAGYRIPVATVDNLDELVEFLKRRGV